MQKRSRSMVVGERHGNLNNTEIEQLNAVPESIFARL
jgi:hypothetical protein